YVPHMGMGVLWLALNDKDRAFAHFMKACELREAWLSRVKVSPVFDAARADPRFQDLLRCVHLEGCRPCPPAAIITAPLGAKRAMGSSFHSLGRYRRGA